MLIRKNYKTKKNAKGLEITGATMGATYQITGTPHDLVEEQRQEQKSRGRGITNTGPREGGGLTGAHSLCRPLAPYAFVLGN